MMCFQWFSSWQNFYFICFMLLYMGLFMWCHYFKKNKFFFYCWTFTNEKCIQGIIFAECFLWIFFVIEILEYELRLLLKEKLWNCKIWKIVLHFQSSIISCVVLWIQNVWKSMIFVCWPNPSWCMKRKKLQKSFNIVLQHFVFAT